MSSKSTENTKVEEIISDAVQEGQLEDGSGSESDGDANAEGEETAGSAELAQGSSSKKKNKKKNKALKALNALRGKKEIPQQVVEQVLEKVKVAGGEDAAGADEDTVRAALEQLKIMDVAKGKSGLGGKNKKDTGGHKFWSTQPVPQLGEEPPQVDGFLEPSVPKEQVRQDAYPLPKDFEWCILDLTDSKQVEELYDLLSLHYVEDDDASFRFQYSAEFLRWALTPPGYHAEWHIGVRVASNKKLVAFIAGVPVSLRVRTNVFQASEINYLCIHKKLRSKRLAPVLIKEVTRQCHLKGVFQAIYTAGVVIPTPVTTCRYYHRSLNVAKLVNVNFTYVPRNMTLARMIRIYKVPSNLHLASSIREMEEKDVEGVHALYTKYMQRFDLVPEMTVEEVRHQFLSGKGTGEKKKEDSRRQGQVVWTYVVEDPESHKITDFFSFYSLPSTIIKHPNHNVLEAAYLFYYATDVAFEDGAEDSGRLKKRLENLVGDALIIADQCKFDVFNALTLMDNVPVLKDLKFGAGDGLLNFYLYNWRTAPMAGVNEVDGVSAGKGVGVVML